MLCYRNSGLSLSLKSCADQFESYYHGKSLRQKIKETYYRGYNKKINLLFILLCYSTKKYLLFISYPFNIFYPNKVEDAYRAPQRDFL